MPLFPMDDINLLPCDGEVYLYSDFFSKSENRHFFSTLQNETLWKHEPITIFGKSMLQPRLTAWYGDAGKDIRYSGIVMHPQEWTSSLLEIKKRVEVPSQVQFTSVLLNQYRDGQDSVGWHRDNEKELGRDPVIASVSFGETRRFVFRHRQDKTRKKVVVELEGGSLLIMRGTTQHYWEHSLPKTSRTVGARLNLTFRVIV